VILKVLNGDTMAEVVGKNMSAVDLCNVIQAWLDVDCQKQGPFEKGLQEVITKYGRFE
jgi:hypothetical protein